MRRNKRNKQRKIIIISLVCLLCVISVGYAAFQTNLNINTRGNLKDKEHIIMGGIKVYTTTENDGLYKDSTEEGRYVYRGANPNNYINIETKTGTELYRIISVESDKTIKVLKDEKLSSNQQFDTPNSRTTAYCNSSYGCNVWGSNTTMLDVNGNNITSMPTKIGGSALALPTSEATLNTYLNGTYYNTLSDKTKKAIDNNHMWNVGVLAENSSQTLETDIAQEKAYKWRGKVGLINPTDYVKASTDTSCKSVYTSRPSPYPCKNNNYMYKSSYKWWTMSPHSDLYSHGEWSLYSGSGHLGSDGTNDSIGVRPVVYLNSDISLSGEGTQTNPYTILSK